MASSNNDAEKRLRLLEKAYVEDRARWQKNDDRWQKNDERWQRNDERIGRILKKLGAHDAQFAEIQKKLGANDARIVEMLRRMENQEKILEKHERSLDAALRALHRIMEGR